MAGSFLPPNDAVRGASDTLWRNADSLNRANQTLSNLMMTGQMASAGSRQTLQPVGDLMANMARQMEQLNRNISQSPLLSGRPLAGGAAMSGGQAWAASYGLPVAVPGMRPSEVGIVAREARSQMASLALEHAARSALTDLVPSMAGMAGAFIPGVGGLVAAPVMAAASSLLMPSIMRSTGLDRALYQESMTRDIQRTIGERMGNLGAGERFRISRGRAANITSGAMEFIKEQQDAYSVAGGVLNFGMNTADYQPLVNAAMNLNTATGLKGMIEKGGRGMKDQLNALLEASAALGATFDEISSLADAYGQTDAGAHGFAQFAGQVERYAAAAGGGLDRRQLTAFALGMRDQARAMGQGGELAMQNVMGLTSAIQSAANQRLLSYNQMAAFGGNTEQERAQNMAASIFNMQAVLAQGPIGGLIRGNILAGRGAGAGMGGFGAFAGGGAAGFLNDPFRFINSMADPTTNALVAGAAPFAYISQLQQSVGRFGPGAARAAFLQRAGSFGMNAVQAGATYDLFSDLSGRLSEKFGNRAGDIVGKAIAYANTAGKTSYEVIEQLKTGALTEADLTTEFTLGGAQGAGSATTQEIDAAIAAQRERLVNAKYNAMAAESERKMGRSGEGAVNDLIRGDFSGAAKKMGNSIRAVVGHAGVVYGGLSDADMQDIERKLASSKQEMIEAAQSGYISDEMRRVMLAKGGLFAAAGVDLSALASADATGATGILSKFRGGTLGYSKEFTSLVRGGSVVDEVSLNAVLNSKDQREAQVIRDSINATLRGMSDAAVSATGFSELADRKLDADEFKKVNVKRLMDSLNKNGSLMMSIFSNAVLRRESAMSAAAQIGESVRAALTAPDVVLTVRPAAK